MAYEGSILVTGAVGETWPVGRIVTGLLLYRGFPVRAVVRNEVGREASLRAAEAKVVADLLEPGDVYRVVRGCSRAYFSMCPSAFYFEASVTMAAKAREAIKLNPQIDHEAWTASIPLGKRGSERKNYI